MSDQSVVKRDEQLPGVQQSSSDLVSIIDRVVGTGELTSEKVAVLERLLAMQMTIREEDRKAAFASAMNRLEAKLPQIAEHGKIFAKDRVTLRSKYAYIEDIDVAIRPLYTEEGFSISYSEEFENVPNGFRKFSAKLLHKDGHSETKYKLMPFDHSDFRTAAQSEASTTSLARRLLLKMHFNLVTRDEDDDGQGLAAVISDEQAKDLEALLQDAKANIPGFLKFMGVASLAEIRASDYTKAINAVQEKLRAQK